MPKRPEPIFTFYFKGIIAGRFAFRCPMYRTNRRKNKDALAFQNSVMSWLYDNAKIQTWCIGNGGTAKGFETLKPIAYKNGNALCLTISDLNTVVKFEQSFRVKGLSPEALTC